MSSPSAGSHFNPSGLVRDENGTGECCDDCNENSFDLSFCNICKFTLCPDCWAKQITHKKLRLESDAIPHEKTDPWVAKQVQKVLSPPADDFTQQKMYLEDEDSAWFGEWIPSSAVVV